MAALTLGFAMEFDEALVLKKGVCNLRRMLIYMINR